MSNIEKAINNDEIYSTPTPLAKADTTWLEAREILAHIEEDKQYSETKKDLRYEIREVRRNVRQYNVFVSVRNLDNVCGDTSGP